MLVLRNLRSRLTVGVVAVLSVVLVIAGALVADAADRTEREALDDRLRRTAELLDVTARDVVQQGQLDDLDRQRLDQTLRVTGSSLRIVIQGAAVDGGEAGRPFPRVGRLPLGYSSHESGGQRYRIYVKSVDLSDAGRDVLEGRVEVSSTLRILERRGERLERRLLLIGLLVLVTTGLATWLAADLVLRPLRRLRRAARGIESDDDLEQRVPVQGPEELRALARSFNAMLGRLERSSGERQQALAATRRFAADAGHELRTPLTSVQAALSTVHRHPSIDPETRTAIIGDALAEQRRLVTLLDGLQALARGDANPVDQVDVDLAGVVAEAAGAIAARHPDVALRTTLPERLVVRGWEPGLRVLADNLLVNAARHGRPGGTISASARRIEGGRAALVVEDDGPGIPVEERERLFEPFVRGRDVERPGSGLGLALVAQQVRHHGATIRIDDSPLGGARFTVEFPPPDAVGHAAAPPSPPEPRRRWSRRP
ncbi:HAMP domain-containing sensor histidine kinase [Patulibacter brassicae]|uniref:histidine kinase n=1 Tax=Patulibacter brassicae TaxID=1705717 RepID=A0ABU4VJQ6_9ACTN|nr:HAMP domain-containing sensor histidine kinase [Patulibacter brassicae]MDX8151339.1 HAMP domain-containing sensor histidine kinase [Patulibacter brassicae]